MKKVFIVASMVFALVIPISHVSAEVAIATQRIKHSISWEKLMNLDGTYLQDKQSSKLLTPEIRRLLGTRYEEFMGSIRVQSPMEIDNGVLIAKGMMPHTGGEFSAIVFFGMSGELFAVLKNPDKLEQFGDKKMMDNPVVKDAVTNLVWDGLS